MRAPPRTISAFRRAKREILSSSRAEDAVDAVAKKLVVSPYTVQTHVQHIYRKMQVHKRSELMDYLNLHRDKG